jgi:hypothetical protein
MRDLVFSIRLTEKERQAINEAARECELGPSTWARLVLLGALGQGQLGEHVKTAKAIAAGRCQR